MTACSSIAYLDCFSGISGDMLLGALLHAGLEQDFLVSELRKLEGVDFQLSIRKTVQAGIGCRQIQVHSPSHQTFRHLPNILDLLKKSSLPETITAKAKQIFIHLANAEAKVHDIHRDKVHFHEVGAVDTIVDIVGALIGLRFFNIERIVCSPLPMGRGFVKCAHGTLPLPAPAVCELLGDTPVYGVDQSLELVTPTGAAIAVSLADDFGAIPPMQIQACGYGAGSQTLKDGQPNLLRLLIGTAATQTESHTVEIIETNLDDWNGETFPYLCDLLFKQSALDVSLSPLIMKKGRPGHLLRVICDPAHSLQLKETILTETTAIGLRYRSERRMTLKRKAVTVDTVWGKITAKEVRTPGGVVIYPEYEACRNTAEANSIPLSRVYQAVTCSKADKEE